LGHVGVWVTDLDNMVAFYERVLGLIETDRGLNRTGHKIVFMTSSREEHHQLVLVEGRDPGNPSTVNQLSFRLGNLDELRAYVQFIDALGGLDPMQVTHGNAWSIYFSDPEGNRIELYCGTPWYASQPFMVSMDLTAPTGQVLQATEDVLKHDPTLRSLAVWESEIDQRLAREAQPSSHPD
jgi:catechol 2,3-dioxygenase-like lactoylglutathione lyase family enzyme